MIEQVNSMMQLVQSKTKTFLKIGGECATDKFV